MNNITIILILLLCKEKEIHFYEKYCHNSFIHFLLIQNVFNAQKAFILREKNILLFVSHVHIRTSICPWKKGKITCFFLHLKYRHFKTNFYILEMPFSTQFQLLKNSEENWGNLLVHCIVWYQSIFFSCPILSHIILR